MCGITWLRYYNPSFCEKTKLNIYVYCLHFILATFTTVGYGDITPVQRLDISMASFISVVSGVVFAGLLGSANPRDTLRAYMVRGGCSGSDSYASATQQMAVIARCQNFFSNRRW